MYRMIQLIENLLRMSNNKIKISFWKLKYGKRIKIGKKFKFRKGLIINISKNGYLEIGDNNFFNNFCSINCHNNIHIGNNNSFGENVKIYDHNHIFNTKGGIKEGRFKTNPIYIGDNNWLGSNCVILSKSNLGNHNVIGAGTILNEKIENDNIVKQLRETRKEKIKFRDKI